MTVLLSLALLFAQNHCAHLLRFRFSSSICSFFVIYMLLAFIVLVFHFHCPIHDQETCMLCMKTREKCNFNWLITINSTLFNPKIKLSNPNSSQGLAFCPQNCGQSQLHKYIYVPTTCLIHSSHKHTDSLPYIDKRCVEISPGSVVLSRPMWKRI